MAHGPAGHLLLPLHKASPTLTQEGFRWRNDDGSETTATWKAAQDTNTSLAVGSTARLRTVIDTSAAATITPTLYYKKTSDSTWLPVPVGPGAGGGPVTITQRANGSNSTSDTETLTSGSFTPTANSKLYVWAVSVNQGQAPTTQNLTISNTGGLTFTRLEQTAEVEWYASSGYPGCAAVFEASVGGSPSSMTVTLDPYPSSSSHALLSLAAFDVLGGTLKQRVPNAVTASGGSPATHTTGTLSATTVTGNLCVLCAGYGADPGGAMTPPSGWTAALSQTQGYTAVSVFTRTNFVGTSEIITDVSTGVGMSFSVLMEFEATSTPNPVYIKTSANITAGGEATTAQLTAPGTFSAGRMWDDENGTDAVTI